MREFRIPVSMAQQIVEHAQAEYPKECCGVLAGPEGEARALYRLRNIDPDPVMRYNADPKDLKHISDEIFDRDWDFVCIYHSHTFSPAFPSQTDVARAFYPEAVYALVSLQDRQRPDLRAFRILDGDVEEIPVIQVQEEPS